ncbi:MAG: thiamine pyrophosphate-dependent enzyme [Salibacteraceae bacterium]
MATAIQSEMQFDRRELTDEQLLQLYRAILFPRMIEEKMLILLRQGKISKWFSGIGQEAISVGVTQALQPEEFILPMHRNLGVFTGRGIELHRLFAQFQGKASGFTSGRDRSFHFGSPDHHIVGMISHLGAQLGVADGIALANKLKKNGQVVVAFSGDGGTSEGDFHEALNVAAVWDLPVIFVIENNGYGLSTPSKEQFRCRQFIDKGIGYGMRTKKVDGNNLLEVYHTIEELSEKIKTNPRPYLLECMTFRMRGHEEASGTKYIPKELFETWAKKDPVANFEQYLKSEGALTEEVEAEMRASIKTAINEGLDIAFNEAAIEADTQQELSDLFVTGPEPQAPATNETREMRLVDAVSDGLKQALQRHPELVVMGQDIAEYGGVFKITQGFLEEFGADRIRNTPLCESAIVGASLGLSIQQHKAVMEMQFADFVSCGFNQIVNNLAKANWRWGQRADVVIRMPTGAGVGAGPFHSQSNEAWFFHTPGLKILYPAFPADAKGLLTAAIADPNPVMFFEHKALYRSLSGEVPTDYYTLPMDQAAVLREGESVSIITFGMGVHWALKLIENQPELDAEIIDLRSLAPIDWATIFASVKKTSKAIILHEDTLLGGIGAEIAARIADDCFEHLDAPVVRSASLDTPVPFAAALEENFLPQKRFADQLQRLLAY